MGCFDKEPRKAGPLIDLGLRPGTFSSPEQIFSLYLNSSIAGSKLSPCGWFCPPWCAPSPAHRLGRGKLPSPPDEKDCQQSKDWERSSKKLRKAAENQKRRKINNKLRKIADTEKDDTQYERVRLGRHLLMSLWERSGHLGAIVFSSQLVPSHHKLFLVCFPSPHSNTVLNQITTIQYSDHLTSWRKRRTAHWPWSCDKHIGPGRKSPCRRSAECSRWMTQIKDRWSFQQWNLQVVETGVWSGIFKPPICKDMFWIVQDEFLRVDILQEPGERFALKVL